MMRISTYNLNTLAIGGAMKVQQDFAKANMQQASSLKSEDFLGYGGSATNTMLNLQREIEQSATWAMAATQVGARVETMYSAVGNCVDGMTKLRAAISDFNSSQHTQTLLDQANTIKTSLLTQMNAQYNGLYVFSGSMTDTAPVDGTLIVGGAVPNTAYYQGNGDILSVRVSGDQIVSYGVTADNPAFEKALRAVQSVIDEINANPGAIGQTIKDLIGPAFDLAKEATDELANMQQNISASGSVLDTAATRQKTTITLLQQSLGDVKNVDVAEAKLRVLTLETQLQASFSAIGDIAKMSIVNYL